MKHIATIICLSSQERIKGGMTQKLKWKPEVPSRGYAGIDRDVTPRVENKMQNGTALGPFKGYAGTDRDVSANTGESNAKVCGT